MANALSVDVEEWFHVCRAERFVPRSGWGRLESRLRPSLDRLLALFEARGARATFFFLGYIADRFPDLPGTVEDAGHEIALHGYWHERVDDLGPADFGEDVDRGLAAVGSRTRGRIRGYRAPEWSLSDRTPWAYEILADRGIRYDSSVLFPRSVDGAAYAVTTGRGAVWEMPVSRFPAAGPGWPFTTGLVLRCATAEFVARGIRRLNRRGVAANLCLHPWEVDPGQPRIRLPLLRGVLHRARLGSTLPKLDRLLAEFRWRSLGEIIRSSPGISGFQGRPQRHRGHRE